MGIHFVFQIKSMGVHYVVQIKSLHSLEVALTALTTFLRTAVTVSNSGLLFQVGDPSSFQGNVVLM